MLKRIGKKSLGDLGRSWYQNLVTIEKGIFLLEDFADSIIRHRVMEDMKNKSPYEEFEENSLVNYIKLATSVVKPLLSVVKFVSQPSDYSAYTALYALSNSLLNNKCANLMQISSKLGFGDFVYSHCDKIQNVSLPAIFTGSFLSGGLVSVLAAFALHTVMSHIATYEHIMVALPTADIVQCMIQGPCNSADYIIDGFRIVAAADYVNLEYLDVFGKLPINDL